VQNQNNTAVRIELDSEPRDTSSEPAPLANRSWDIVVSRLLEQAATICVEHGVDVDSFMRGAWNAYVESRPGMRAQLEETQLREHLDELRKLGRVAAA
jgi:hypothetical protein